MIARLLYADERLLAVDKPAGLSLATKRADSGAAAARLVAALPAAEREGWGIDPAATLLVHRLDVTTSGVVLLARDEEMHRALALALSERRLRKTYLAVVWGRPRPANGLYDAPLGPDRRDRRRMLVDPAGRAARTRYVVRGAGAHASLVELHPETGRTHQIRVHLAAAGHPIVGDDLYGGPRQRGVRDPELRRALDPGRTLLHAWRLELPDLLGRGELIVTAPPPPDFAAAVAALGLEL